MSPEILTREEIAILQMKCYSRVTTTSPFRPEEEIPVVSCSDSSYFDVQQFARFLEQAILQKIQSLNGHPKSTEANNAYGPSTDTE